ncbi:MAG TPA: lysozyme [Rickettsia endosymbiont of Omalisus fontisbellaquei]|nr:lysozyme [Rickettsia endosymbiont of Omalisus fontisbellaquei]
MKLLKLVNAKNVKLQGLVKRWQVERSLFLSETGTALIANEIVVTSNVVTNYLK